MSVQQVLLALGSGGSAPVEDAVVWNSADKTVNLVLSNGDRDATTNDAFNGGVRATHPRAAAYKAYCEFKIVSTDGYYPVIGLATATWNLATDLGSSTTSWAYITGIGWLRWNGSGSTIAACSSNDIAMMAVDIPDGKIWFGKNGTWSGDPAAGTGAAFSNIPTSGNLYIGFSNGDPGKKATLQAMSAQQTYPPPAGFAAWAVP